ncbi:hypothetical protein HanXRQr2_Chr09g0385921 [Helianthus annuus]|uniref:Secreted protein n=1 Tax=Helianthus annuus TaxID=4232 RepID=A0A251TWG9_HELAN|nr:hypothetical protein HanXRQr2_Chr09g0385921 [Helianthus annuus]KAJ0892937.1 hypothetical protein HanPSC8_Chr09g0371931 [Helianthus annuus]
MNVGFGFWILCCFLNSYAGHLNITNIHLQNEVVKQVLCQSGQVDSSFVTRLPRCQVYFSHYKHHNSVCDIL